MEPKRLAFCRFSLSAKDYRILSTKNKNTFPLIDFVVKKKRGKEIGSDNYFKKSKYRFLKTVNISNSLCFDEASIEFCNPQKNHNPQKDDILIAKDGGGDGLGEIALYNKENKDNQDSISAGIIAIQIKKEYLYYILGILKLNHFKNFIDLNTAQGSTIRHSKEIALKYQIPFPTAKNNKSPKDIEKFVSLIVQNIIDKEEQIKAKNEKIDFLIGEELRQNQNNNEFKYQLPRISEIKSESRLDTGLYGIKNKEFVNKMRSYKFGLQTIMELGFKSKRGHNLAISVAGTSYYSDIAKKNFYLLVTSTNIDDARTLSKKRYLGNLNKLVQINQGDIMFSATGQVETSVGKTYVFCDLNQKTTSNFNSFFIIFLQCLSHDKRFNSKRRRDENRFADFCRRGFKRNTVDDEISFAGDADVRRDV